MDLLDAGVILGVLDVQSNRANADSLALKPANSLEGEDGVGAGIGEPLVLMKVCPGKLMK